MHTRTRFVLVPSALLALGTLGLWWSTTEPLPPGCRAGAAPGAAPAGPAAAPLAEYRRSTTVAGPEGIAVGDEFEFASQWGTEHALRHEQQGHAQVVRVHVQGPLRLAVLGATSGELALGCRLPAAVATVTIDGQAVEAESLAADLAQGAIVRMGRDGTVTGFRFADGIDPRSRNVLRSLFASLRIGGDVGSAAWTATEADATGAATVYAERSVEGGLERIVWQKRGHGTASGAATSRSGRGRLEREDGDLWWRRIESHESADVEFTGMGIRLVAGARVAHELLASRRGVAVGAFAWDLPWCDADGAADALAAARSTEHDRWRADLVGTTLAAEVAGVRAALASGGDGEAALHGAAERLLWLLRTRPAAVAEAAELVRAADLDDRVVGVVAAALAGEGSAAAQQVLAGLAVDATQNVARRGAALCAMFQLQEPSTAVLAAVRTNLGPAADADLVDTATLLLGALAGPSRLGQGPHDPLPSLLAGEAGALANGSLPCWLEALGNSGRSEVVEVGARYLRADDAAVRVAAVAALRRIGTPASVLVLAGAAADRDGLVRVRAVEALHGCEDPSVPPILLRSLDDGEVAVRHAAVAALLDRRDAVRFRERLVRVAAEDPVAAVRAAAAGGVARLDGRG